MSSNGLLLVQTFAIDTMNEIIDQLVNVKVGHLFHLRFLSAMFLC